MISSADEELKLRLINIFLKENQSKFSELVKVIKSGNVEHAYRIAHTLKGQAGLLEKPELQKAAEDVERLLGEKKTKDIHDISDIPGTSEMNILETELNSVLKEFYDSGFSEKTPDLNHKVKSFDREKEWELFAQLEPLLDSGNPESFKYIDDLQQIWGCGQLIENIKNLDFSMAKASLKMLMNARG
jgi:HPt (histidine-containing phosphotransfer) domain-containing protein